MERVDLSQNGEWTEFVARAESGEPVEFTRNGEVVAELKVPQPATRPIFDPEKLKAIHDLLGPAAGGDAIGLVRAMRDGRDF